MHQCVRQESRVRRTEVEAEELEGVEEPMVQDLGLSRRQEDQKRQGCQVNR